MKPATRVKIFSVVALIMAVNCVVRVADGRTTGAVLCGISACGFLLCAAVSARDIR